MSTQVTDMLLLRGMAAAGHIVLHKDTGKVVNWKMVYPGGANINIVAYYIEKSAKPFEYNGKRYKTLFAFQGFPYPIVIEEYTGAMLP